MQPEAPPRPERPDRPERPVRPDRLDAPNKATILTLPRWADVPLSAIRLPALPGDIEAAIADLQAHRFIGFDTETKPVFVRTAERLGPDVVQFATLEHAYLFQLANPACKRAVEALLVDEKVTKVGFGLSGDQKQLLHTMGVRARPVVDLDAVFRRMGYIKEIGIKSAVAVVFGQRLVKSKRVTTTNWASPVLSPQQRVYAANDAQVALRVWHELERDKHLPVQAPAAERR
jgi:ribonuclease D